MICLVVRNTANPAFVRLLPLVTTYSVFCGEKSRPTTCDLADFSAQNALPTQFGQFLSHNLTEARFILYNQGVFMSIGLFVGSLVVVALTLGGCSDSRKSPSASTSSSSSSSSSYVPSSDQDTKNSRDVARLYNTTEQRANDVASRAAELGGTSKEKMMEALKAARGE